MKEVYIKNPQMGDPNSVDPRLAEIAHNIEKLQAEAQKFEVRVIEYSTGLDERFSSVEMSVCVCFRAG